MGLSRMQATCALTRDRTAEQVEAAESHSFCAFGSSQMHTEPVNPPMAAAVHRTQSPRIELMELRAAFYPITEQNCARTDGITFAISWGARTDGITTCMSHQPY